MPRPIVTSCLLAPYKCSNSLSDLYTFTQPAAALLIRKAFQPICGNSTSVCRLPSFRIDQLSSDVSAEDTNRLHSLSSALSGQALIDYLGSHLRVNYVRSAAGDDIVLTNSGPFDIPRGGRWSIYFNHASMNYIIVNFLSPPGSGRTVILLLGERKKQRCVERSNQNHKCFTGGF